MVTVKFQGWFECRLATDPDPVDELRGVSGYMKCLAGEPDFDRVIRFHNPIVSRAHTPKIGVHISKLYNNNEIIEKHFLLGSEFNLEGNPKFFGFNGIIGDDGDEPIVPFIVSIKKEKFILQRAMVDETPAYPFKILKPTNGILLGSNDICEQTNIWDIASHLMKRAKLLENDLLSETNETNIFNIKQRLDFLKNPSGVALRYFNAKMNWNFRFIPTGINKHPGLGGAVSIQNAENIITFSDLKTPWAINFWMGGWDPDGLCGYVSGVLKLPTATIK